MSELWPFPEKWAIAFLEFFTVLSPFQSFLAMKCMKHLIETDDSNDSRVQNDFFMISGSRDTIYHFSHGHVTLETIVKIEIGSTNEVLETYS